MIGQHAARRAGTSTAATASSPPRWPSAARLAEDLYITLGGVDFADGSATFKLVVNPLVDWVWFGFMLLAIGTGIALLPETALAPIAARVTAPPGGAAARAPGPAALLLLLGLGLLGAEPRAAPPPTPSTVKPGDVLVRHQPALHVRHGRPRLRPHAGGLRGRVRRRPAVPRRRSRRMLEAGQDPPGDHRHLHRSATAACTCWAPRPTRGFNRLAWALPYGLGLAGAGALAFTAWRFSKRSKGGRRRQRHQAAPGPGPHQGPRPRGQARGRAFARRHVSATDETPPSAPRHPRRRHVQRARLGDRRRRARCLGPALRRAGGRPARRRRRW